MGMVTPAPENHRDPLDGGELGTVIQLQQISDTADFLPGHWLTEGAQVADAVALLRTERSLGTGFLVSPWLLLTNHHVLEGPDDATGAHAVFRYVADDRNRITAAQEGLFAPERCFVTSGIDDLDYTLVALAPMADGRAPGAVLSALPMRGAARRVVRDQPVNIIQHPQGRPREIAIRNNRLIGFDQRYLSYETDSEPGSSGSPVLDDDWELIGLHSRSESRWGPSPQSVGLAERPATDHPSAPRRTTVANKGIRIPAIIADLMARTAEYGPDAAALIDELLAFGGNSRRLAA